MAFALDSSVSGASATPGSSLTWSHTCSGSDRILFVAAATNEADNTDYVTGVTYNGVAMTRVDTFRSPGQGGLVMYMLVNPATGANNVVVSLSASKNVYGASSSYTQAVQSGQPDSTNGNAADPTTSLTVNTTVVLPGSWLISAAARKAGSSDTISAGTNTTARTVNAYVAIGDSNGAVGTGAQGQTWELSGTNGLAVINVSVAAIADVVSATSNASFFM